MQGTRYKLSCPCPCFLGLLSLLKDFQGLSRALLSSFSSMEKDGEATMDLSKLELPLTRRRPATRKRGAFSLLRAAVFMVHRRPAAKKAPTTGAVEHSPESGADGTWKNIVGGMRPLHHHHQFDSPPPPAVLFLRHESFHDVLVPPSSPRSSADSMSRYASAEDLRSLDTSEGDDESPNAIDVRAEEFIANFYEQIKLQRMQSFNRINMPVIEEGTS